MPEFTEKELDALLTALLVDGYPGTFTELYHLIHNKPKPSTEHPESRRFLMQVKAQLCAAEAAKRQGNAGGVTAAYLEVARLYRSLEQTRLAIFFLERALDLARASSSPASECSALHELVLAHEALGETDAAVAAAEAHRAAAQAMGSGEEEGRAAEELSRTYRTQASDAESKGDGSSGEKETARKMRLMELTAAREVGEPAGEAEAAYAVGRCYMMAGQPQYGVNYFNQYLRLAKTLQEQNGDTAHIARAYAALAAAHVSEHAYDAALECLQELLTISQASGNQSAHAHALEALGTLLARQGKYGEAEASLTAGYRIRKELMEGGGEGASRPELDKTRILLGVVKAAAAGARSSAMFSNVVAGNVQALLEWRVSRVDLLKEPVGIDPATSSLPPSLSRLLSTSYRPTLPEGGSADSQGEDGPHAAAAAVEAAAPPPAAA